MGRARDPRALRRRPVRAVLANEIVARVEETDHLSLESFADLRAEGWALLGNARRISADLPGAEEALLKAQRCLEAGTHARELKADFSSLLASLRCAQGQAEVAAELVEREIALRRLLGDQNKLGVALIDRGWIAYRCDDGLEVACRFVRGGIRG